MFSCILFFTRHIDHFVQLYFTLYTSYRSHCSAVFYSLEMLLPANPNSAESLSQLNRHFSTHSYLDNDKLSAVDRLLCETWTFKRKEREREIER